VDVGDLDVEQAQYDRGQVHQGDAAGGRDHAELEVLGGPDQPAAVGEQQREQGAEGQQDRLEHDALEACLVECRNGAQEQALRQRIERRADRRPLLLEDGGHGQHEAADQAAPQVQARAAGELAGIGQRLVPGEGRGDHRQQQQQAGLVDGAVEGHRPGAARDHRAAAGVEEGGIGEGWVAAAHVGLLGRVWMPAA